MIIEVNVQQGARQVMACGPMWSAWTRDERFPTAQRARIGVSMIEALSNLKYALRRHLGAEINLTINKLPRKRLKRAKIT